MLTGSVAAQLAAEDRIVYAAIAAALIAAFVIWRVGRAYAGRGKSRHLAGTPAADPSGRVEALGKAFTGPVPTVGEIDTTDYMRRFRQHQPCDAWPCPHHDVHTLHCRSGEPYPCEGSGLMNEYRGHFDNDPRNRNDERRWPR